MYLLTHLPLFGAVMLSQSTTVVGFVACDWLMLITCFSVSNALLQHNSHTMSCPRILDLIPPGSYSQLL